MQAQFEAARGRARAQKQERFPVEGDLELRGTASASSSVQQMPVVREVV